VRNAFPTAGGLCYRRAGVRSVIKGGALKRESGVVTLDAANLGFSFLDGPTLAFVMVCIVALLGLFLMLAWLQQRDVRALAWWGAAYLIGASALALWGAPQPWVPLPQELPFAMIFVVCGMIWNGVRLFRGRPLRPLAACAGAAIWLVLCQLPLFADGSAARFTLGVFVVASYTFFIALELSRERRKSMRSRVATVVVPGLHAAIFLMPLAMRAFMPADIAINWITVFALETILYAVGTAFRGRRHRSHGASDLPDGLTGRSPARLARAGCAARAAKKGAPCGAPVEFASRRAMLGGMAYAE
jgi:hypothetical protein